MSSRRLAASTGLLCSCASIRNSVCFFFFFNDTATTEIYTLSLHDALPILIALCWMSAYAIRFRLMPVTDVPPFRDYARSEEHTSELQSQSNLVCRLLLEKKKPPRPASRRAAASNAGVTGGCSSTRPRENNE